MISRHGPLKSCNARQIERLVAKVRDGMLSGTNEGEQEREIRPPPTVLSNPQANNEEKAIGSRRDDDASSHLERAPTVPAAASNVLSLPVGLLKADFNKMDDAALNAAKSAMQPLFDRNRIIPGEPGYVYDVRKDFKPTTTANEWDDSQGSSNSEGSSGAQLHLKMPAKVNDGRPTVGDLESDNDNLSDMSSIKSLPPVASLQSPNVISSSALTRPPLAHSPTFASLLSNSPPPLSRTGTLDSVPDVVVQPPTPPKSGSDGAVVGPGVAGLSIPDLPPLPAESKETVRPANNALSTVSEIFATQLYSMPEPEREVDSKSRTTSPYSPFADPPLSEYGKSSDNNNESLSSLSEEDDLSDILGPSEDSLMALVNIPNQPLPDPVDIHCAGATVSSQESVGGKLADFRNDQVDALESEVSEAASELADAVEEMMGKISARGSLVAGSMGSILPAIEETTSGEPATAALIADLGKQRSTRVVDVSEISGISGVSSHPGDGLEDQLSETGLMSNGANIVDITTEPTPILESRPLLQICEEDNVPAPSTPPFKKSLPTALPLPIPLPLPLPLPTMSAETASSGALTTTPAACSAPKPGGTLERNGDPKHLTDDSSFATSATDSSQPSHATSPARSRAASGISVLTGVSGVSGVSGFGEGDLSAVSANTDRLADDVVEELLRMQTSGALNSSTITAPPKLTPLPALAPTPGQHVPSIEEWTPDTPVAPQVDHSDLSPKPGAMSSAFLLSRADEDEYESDFGVGGTDLEEDQSSSVETVDARKIGSGTDGGTKGLAEQSSDGGSLPAVASTGAGKVSEDEKDDEVDSVLEEIVFDEIDEEF
ncbi:hypothetical protein HDU93_001566 [Gonapodya sp. JEL0774]|nr:hypothetical protein HDU93_001566 [Gonapodya sp. JEL0774]